MKRTQIYLEGSQDERLARRAAAEGTTKSELIREAIDAYLGADDGATHLEAFRAAVRAAAGSVPRLPEGRRYVDEVRRADARRAEELGRRQR